MPHAPDILTLWPYAALLLGALGLALLLRSPRPRDPRWLFALGLPIYMVHQFEEHGVDLLGRPYAFQAALCGTLGHTDVAACPADTAFIFAANVGSVWIAGLLAWLVGPRRPGVGAAFWALVLLNALAHTAASLRDGAYNPGVATSLLVFAPLGLWTFAQLLRQGLLDRRRLVLAFLVGAAQHAVLIGSLVAFERGLLSHAALLAVQVVNGSLALLLVFAGGDLSPRTVPASSPPDRKTSPGP